jgi:hypothetical protein
MDLIRFELSLGFMKGIVLGIYQEDFYDEDVFERDVNLCLGMVFIRLTMVYN